MLDIPRKGFTEFYVHRHVGAMGMEIIIDDNSYEIGGPEDLKLWLFHVGIPKPFCETFVDYCWNWRLLKYNLVTKYLTIPEVQDHPLEPVAGKGEYNPEKKRANIDLFDPLNDRPNRRT